MAYALVFAVIIAGYVLVDWGHYRVKHEQVSMWYLVSGKGDKTPKTPVRTAANLDTLPQVYAA